MRIMSQSLIVSMVIESFVRMLALTFEGLCTPSQNFLTSCSGFGTPTYSTSPFRSLSVVIGRYRFAGREAPASTAAILRAVRSRS